jgi:uncharacterized protein YbbK (DUF523 family)
MITTDQIEQLKKRIAKVCDEFITGIETPIPDKLIIQGHEVTKETDEDYQDGNGIYIADIYLGSLKQLSNFYNNIDSYQVKSIALEAITLTTEEIKSIIEWDKW